METSAAVALVAWIAVAAPRSPAQDGAAPPAGAKELTLEQTMGPNRVSFGSPPPPVAFAKDGVHLEVQRDGKTVWHDPKTQATSEPPPADPKAKAEADAKEAALVAALAKANGLDEEKAKRVVRSRLAASSDGKTLLFTEGGDLYLVQVGKEKGERLTTTPAPEENARLSPDGRHVSFVRSNDLYLIGTDTLRERAVTKDGAVEKSERLNGKLDWVYQEEVYGRGNFQATWWSPDSKHLAFLALDETGVPHHPIVDHMPSRAELEDTRYPKAGDPNPKVALGVARASDGHVTWVDLAKYAQDEPIVVRVGWTPKGDRVCFQVQDREQTWLDLDECDPDSGKVERLFRETTTSWVDVLGEPRWLADESFLWLSERTGYKHLYHCDAKGKLLGAVTSGEWEVRDVAELDEKAKLVWFTASKDSAIGANLYRVALDGSGLTRLTTGGGSHSVEWNADKSLFLDRVSSVAFPPEVRLCDGKDGHVLEVVAKASVPALAEYRFSAPELLEIPTRDGFAMDATIVKPLPCEPGRKYAVWLPTYSGPDAPSVSDSWNGDPWPQFLAQHGVAVLQVNNRTSSRKGHVQVAKCYQQFGVQELADLEDALDWLGRNREWADLTRVGISGWSYGGFMTAFALTHSTKFKLGVAGAGVYDWRLYDTIYTERYMKTPAHNPDGYAKTSCVGGAKELTGWLVLAHGTMDDNVHLQNSVQLAMALEKAGKDDFDMMLYPKSRHGPGSPEQSAHLRKLTWRAIRERLGVE